MEEGKGGGAFLGGRVGGGVRRKAAVIVSPENPYDLQVLPRYIKAIA